jgi:hypothetical protein
MKNPGRSDHGAYPAGHVPTGSRQRPQRRSIRRAKAVSAVVAAVAGMASLAPQALAAITHSTTGVTSCYNSNGALRVVNAQNGATCAARETPLTWNSKTISATQWSSGTITPMNRAAGARDLAMAQPGNKLPAGSWVLSATVLTANGLGTPVSFRCWLQTRGTLGFINGQLNDWAGPEGWHQTMTIPGLVNLAEPDWIDVYCSHDQPLGNGGVLQIESAYVVAQRVAATF